MRDYLFHGKCRDEDKWIEGCLIHLDNLKDIRIIITEQHD